jgi:Predicted nucleic acid-binding protein, contains PIN domain
MSWVVDTCVLIDVLEDDPSFGRASAQLLEKSLRNGLLLCPVTMIELSPAFAGDLEVQKHFLEQAGVDFTEGWTAADTESAYQAWNAYVQARRTNDTPKRPLADLLIGAFACRQQGLITRNPTDFRRWFPKLKLRQP